MQFLIGEKKYIEETNTLSINQNAIVLSPTKAWSWLSA